MWETYRMLGHEREQELLREARRLQALGPVRVRLPLENLLALLVLRGRRKENLMKTLSKRLRAALLLAISMLTAAFIATPGVAKPNLGGSTAAGPDLVERWIAVQPQALRPDDRAGVRGVPALARREATSSASSSAFQWGDAGLGAGLTAAGLLLAGSGFAAARRVRRRRPLSGLT